MGRVINEEVCRRAGIERELATRSDQRVLRWFRHVERMDEYHMARRVLMAKVSGGWVQERPRLGWMGGVCEGGLRQQRYYGGGCATMRERVENPGSYVTN